MKLGKSVRYLKYTFFLFGTLFICNAESVKSSNIWQFSKVEKKTEIDFDNVFFKYTSSFDYYDSYSNQFDNFFGISYLEAENKRNFQDLSISNDSRDLRDLYDDMLEGLTTIEKLKLDKEPFYKSKI